MRLQSFRDPAGRVFEHEGRILRAVEPEGVADASAFLASPAGQKLMADGSVVGTKVLPSSDSGTAMLLEHERVAFPSYPYEWPAEMLHAAGRLTLDLALDLLPKGFGLKDATPYNVLFRGPQPVFVDVLSFERRRPDDPTWLPYAQFLRTFVLPLLAYRAFGLPTGHTLLARRDGLEPEDLYRCASPWRRVAPGFLTKVSLPVWLGARQRSGDESIYRPRRTSPEKARFILEHLFRGLRRTLDGVAPRPRRSAWSGYMAGHSYAPEAFAAKERFVGEFLEEARPETVLDVGANTGHFSRLAARAGARVVAIDADAAATGEAWRQALAEKADVLPLVVDLSRPTPALGWRNSECAAFLDRVRGSIDTVFMLAVVHHMLVTERAPLEEIFELAADIATRWLVIEYVAPEDSMFRTLVRGREQLHRDLTEAQFETTASRRFAILRSAPVGPSRRLYLLRKKTR